MKRLIPEPLTAEGFAPFGAVIEADPASAIGINAGFTTRFHALAEVEVEGGACGDSRSVAPADEEQRSPSAREQTSGPERALLVTSG